MNHLWEEASGFNWKNGESGIPYLDIIRIEKK